MPTQPSVRHHGTAHAIGCSHVGYGPYTRMFSLKGAPSLEFDDQLLDALGAPGGIMHDERRDSGDSNVPAGYTFFGQFVDHDLTLDTGSELNTPRCGGKRKLNKIDELRNQRSPSLDLDCVYGLGPESMPHLYDRNRDGMLIDGTAEGRPWDLARSPSGTALIGDPRNDENIFVSQMQLLWIRFHNALMLSSPGHGSTLSRRFEAVQTKVRHHYQYIVLYDYLRRVCHKETYCFALRKIHDAVANRLEELKRSGTAGLPTDYPLVFRESAHGCTMPMPVEFSVAAYRFGHTTVRDTYPANVQYTDVELFDERFMAEGFAPLPQELEVDWRFLLNVDCCIDPVRTKAFDHLLADELIRMPDPIVGVTSDRNRSLAFRNLVRGRSFGLPAGEVVAKALNDAGYDILSKGDAMKLVALLEKRDLIDKVVRPGTKEKGTPLFFYILREAGTLGKGQTLGPVGSALLLEVFGRLLLECSTSFFFSKDESDKLDGCDDKSGGYQEFVPEPCILKERKKCDDREPADCDEDPDCKPPVRLELADIVRYVNAVHNRLGLHKPAGAGAE